MRIKLMLSLFLTLASFLALVVAVLHLPITKGNDDHIAARQWATGVVTLIGTTVVFAVLTVRALRASPGPALSQSTGKGNS
jgi:hypothetical protein